MLVRTFGNGAESTFIDKDDATWERASARVVERIKNEEYNWTTYDWPHRAWNVGLGDLRVWISESEAAQVLGWETPE